MNVGLPDRPHPMFEQLPKTIARVFVLARHDAGAFDLSRKPPESFVVVRRQAFFHPIHTLRFQHLGNFDRVRFCPRHPAVEHDVAIGPERLAGALDERHVLAHAFAPVGGPIRDRQLQALVPKLDVLFDVVARAVCGQPGFGFAAEQLVDGHVEGLSHDVPQREIDGADRVDRHAHPPIRHRRAPHDVPETLDVQGIFLY